MPLIRADKFFSSQGLCARRAFKDFIKRNVIELNGARVKAADEKFDTDTAEIKMNGNVLTYSRYIYLMMNKPSGLISATRDPNERDRTVIDLLRDPYRGRELFPVGRLDKDTVGLLILTNDGMFAHNSLSPKKHVAKVYYAELERSVSDCDIELFLQGIEIDGGYVCRPAVLCKGEKDRQATVEICEGKFHQIKKMFEATGNKVLYLKRLSFGGIKLDETLEAGEYRELDEEEMKILNLLK